MSFSRETSKMPSKSNEAVFNFFAQAKLNSKTKDVWELEADKVAEKITISSSENLGKIPVVHLHAATKVDESAKRVASEISHVGAQSLPESERRLYERRLGHDFSRVKIYDNDLGFELARAQNALAYTVGGSIVFGRGQYSLVSSEGRKLLAHELAHVIQQDGYPVLVQAKDNPEEPAEGWSDLAKRARRALASGDVATARQLYREAIKSAALFVPLPEGLSSVDFRLEDIVVDFNLSTHASVQGDEIPASPTNYWRWMRFGETSVMQTRANTEATVLHELVHVRQYMRMWDEYQRDSSPNKESWHLYHLHHSPRLRVEGPEEMESTMTSLKYLKRQSILEQREALRGIFVAFINATAYTPPQNENIGLSATEALPQITQFFEAADLRLRQEMGDAVRWALLKVEPPEERWLAVIQDLGKIAAYSYSSELRRVYNELAPKPRAPATK